MASHVTNDGQTTVRGFGLPATTPKDVITTAASGAQQTGFRSFWLNNPPGQHALPLLGDVAGSVPGLWLGVGVIPLSAESPEEIAREARRSSLSLDRVYLGIGSGHGSGGVQRVRGGIQALREELQGFIVVAALGPKMCKLAGAEADGVLLNWLTPAFARTSIEWVREGAKQAGKAAPRLMAYVRVAFGGQAISRLQKEASSYEAIPQYAAHFQRMGVDAMGTTVTGTTPEEIQRGLAAWNGVVDEVVARGITAQDTVEEVQKLLEAAKPE